MPLNRQQPFQYVPQSGVTSANYDGADGYASTIAKQLQGLLSQSVETRVSMLGSAQDRLQERNRELAAETKLLDAAGQANYNKDVLLLNNELDKERAAIALANEQAQTYRQEMTQILALKERGVTSFIENASSDQLRNVINSGQAGVLDPLGLLKLEEQIGKRLATEDAGKALIALSTPSENGPATVESIVGSFLQEKPLNSDIAKGAYVSTLTGDIRRYRDGEMLKYIETTRQNAVENLGVRLTRDIAFDARDGSLSVPKVGERLFKFQADFRLLNPMASEGDVYRATSAAMVQAAKSLSVTDAPLTTLQSVYNQVASIQASDPLYQPLIEAAKSDIQQVIDGKRKALKDGAINSVKVMTDQTQIVSARQSLPDFNKQGLSTLDIAEISDAINKQELELATQTRAAKAVSGKLVNLPNTPAQEEALQREISAHMATNPIPLGNGQARNWTLPEEFDFTVRRIGRLTTDQINRLNGMMSLPTDSPEGALQLQEGLRALEAAYKANPRSITELTNKMEERPVLAMMLSQFLPGRNYSPSALSQTLARLPNQYLTEAKSTASKKLSEETVGGDIVKQAFESADGIMGLRWTAFQADVDSKKVREAFSASYVYNYARLRNNGSDETIAHEQAVKTAKQDITSTARTADLGGLKYIVAGDFPLQYGLDTGKRLDPNEFGQVMEAVNSLWVERRNAVLKRGLDSGVIEDAWFSSDSDKVTLNIDDWQIRGNKLQIPIRVNKQDQSVDGVFKYDNFLEVPMDPVELKKAVQSARQRSFERQSERLSNYNRIILEQGGR